MSCGVGHRGGSDLALLWLWRRLAATAPIRPLAREPPCAAGAVQEMAKKALPPPKKIQRQRLKSLQRHRINPQPGAVG